MLEHSFCDDCSKKNQNILLKKIFEEKKFIWKLCIKKKNPFPLSPFLFSAW